MELVLIILMVAVAYGFGCLSKKTSPSPNALTPTPTPIRYLPEDSVGAFHAQLDPWQLQLMADDDSRSRDGNWERVSGPAW